jgi:small subunit ribosomal protein S6
VIRPYETVVVFDGTLGDDAIHKEQGKIEELLRKSAEFERTDIWGKREMAYPIRRKKLGYYCVFNYKGDGSIVERLQNEFRLNNSVIRFLSAVRDDNKKIIPTPRKKEESIESEREKTEGEVEGA